MENIIEKNQSLGQHIRLQLDRFRDRNDEGKIVIFTDNFFLETRAGNPLAKALQKETQRVKDMGYLVFELTDFRKYVKEDVIDSLDLFHLYDEYLGPVMDSGIIDLVIELPRSERTVIGEWMTKRARQSGIKILSWTEIC